MTLKLYALAFLAGIPLVFPVPDVLFTGRVDPMGTFAIAQRLH